MSEGTTNKAMVFACCGAADVGEIADLAARKLHKEESAKLYCLTGIGAGLELFINNANAAPGIIAIDGCPVDCTKKLLEKYGIMDFEFLRVTDLGLEKGKSPVTETSIESVVYKARALLKGMAS